LNKNYNDMKILIVVPAYNEELILEKSILKLLDFCRINLSDDWHVVIADNNSKDKTADIGKSLAQKFPNLEYLFIEKKGKGIAIKQAWQSSEADIYCFMDADLATDLSSLPLLISEMKDGNDIVVGSRFHKDSKVKRSISRKFISLGYRVLVKIILGLKVDDAPCGFKAINNKIKENIPPKIENQKWFFDSELIILAEKNGYKIKEIPVIWHDPREGQDKSRVNIFSLSLAYFSQLLKLRKRLKSK